MCGELVRRMDVKASEIADDLDLATAPVQAGAICYELANRAGWIVIARHQAREVIQIHGNRGYAYPEPMITYATELPEMAAGALNLGESPTCGMYSFQQVNRAAVKSWSLALTSQTFSRGFAEISGAPHLGPTCIIKIDTANPPAAESVEMILALAAVLGDANNASDHH